MNDGIHLGKCQRPQLRVAEGTCARCGNPILGVGNLCVGCMNRGFREEVLAQQRSLLAAYPEARMSLARDKAQRRHLALIGREDQAWCGLRLTESKRRRMVVTADKLPMGICALCLEAFEEAKKGATA